MKKIIANNITVNNKKHEYTLKEKSAGVVFVECKDANIAQEFLKEDIADLIIDLPNLIIAEKEHKKKQSEVIRFRISVEDKKNVEKKAVKEGYPSVSEYLRHLALS
jgi:predicted DNA binding CopG/RHH family protein